MLTNVSTLNYWDIRLSFNLSVFKLRILGQTASLFLVKVSTSGIDCQFYTRKFYTRIVNVKMNSYFFLYNIVDSVYLS